MCICRLDACFGRIKTLAESAFAKPLLLQGRPGGPLSSSSACRLQQLRIQCVNVPPDGWWFADLMPVCGRMKTLADECGFANGFVAAGSSWKGDEEVVAPSVIFARKVPRPRFHG